MRIPTKIALAVMIVAGGLTGCNSGGGGSGSGGAQPQGKSAFPLKIGEVGPIADDNARQQPFVCVTNETDLGPAIVDNQDGIGDAVTDGASNVIGYSADCGAGMKVNYYYRADGDAAGDKLKKYDLDNPPGDVKTINVDGRDIPLIIRHEEGVINRFIYSISILSPAPDGDVDKPNLSEWNGDAVFYFTGGTGVGHGQSYTGNALRAINDVGTGQTGALALLEHGYAVINSTGTATSTTYNLKLTGQTAHMVKQQFEAAYGKPKHTFGLGASGGAVQQLVYAQNDPGLIDALIPIQPFPDMITQVNPVGDCELLHYYFDKMDAQVNGTGSVNPKWTTWSNRQMIVGFHGVDLQSGDPGYSDLQGSDANQIIQATSSAAGHVGADVCMTEWFGAVPQFFNPLWGSQGGYSLYYDQTVWSRTPISYFDDLVDIFGTIPNTDLARTTYDNVGVQYGLQALKRGEITKKEFLDLNAHTGSWVARQDMVEPGYPFEGGPSSDNIDPWSARNGTSADHPDPSDVAPRIEGSVEAMRAAYRAGLVFRGNIDKPIIIIEPYLEPELNEHASREPFAVRQRLIDARGNADNLAIWMLGGGDDQLETDFVLKALDLETKWLDAGNRPNSVKDACYQGDGTLIAEGDDVFQGQVSAGGGQVLGGMWQNSGASPGACTQAYPIYSDARVESGLNVSDRVFKCALKPVNEALDDGTYGGIDFTVAEQLRLAQIFPTGVCDYSKPDQGLPEGF